jgi:YfiH family protein
MSNLIYAISKVKDGNMAFKYGEKEEVLKNRIEFLKKANLTMENTSFITVNMKDSIITIDETFQGKGSKSKDDAINCDALITNRKELGMYLDVGDCLPILIHDPKEEVLALVHGGWPNTDLKIVQKVVKKLVTEFNCKVSNLEIIVGPGIQKESLIYDNNIFNLISSDWKEYIYQDSDDPEKFHIDNLGFTIDQLKELGIEDKQIQVDTTDTYLSEEYFSHVRDFRQNQKDRGRFCMIAKLVD